MNELTNSSLMILCDLSITGRRLQKRLANVAQRDIAATTDELVALEERGLITINGSGRGSFAARITDAGLAKHREIINQFRA